MKLFFQCLKKTKNLSLLTLPFSCRYPFWCLTHQRGSPPWKVPITHLLSHSRLLSFISFSFFFFFYILTQNQATTPASPTVQQHLGYWVPLCYAIWKRKSHRLPRKELYLRRKGPGVPISDLEAYAHTSWRYTELHSWFSKILISNAITSGFKIIAVIKLWVVTLSLNHLCDIY